MLECFMTADTLHSNIINPQIKVEQLGGERYESIHPDLLVFHVLHSNPTTFTFTPVCSTLTHKCWKRDKGLVSYKHSSLLAKNISLYYTLWPVL
jgi:hypothetical protein